MAKLDSAFEVIQVPEEKKLPLLQSKLQGYTFTFFRTELATHPEMTYAELREKLRDKYYPRALRRARETEVREVGHENLPVDEIIRKLRDNLSKVPDAAPTKDFRISLILRRLSPGLRRFVAGFQHSTLAAAEQTALAYATEGGKRMQPPSQDYGGKRQRIGGPSDSRRDCRSSQSRWTESHTRGGAGPAGSQH